ncbi:hypothetical protein BDZ45DRAFT_736146 [Acephala macrosclerotiorum]|nr:hypothetical protein BDZ45DRAFT_736146 [Acephala macrosclerotiorum]
MVHFLIARAREKELQHFIERGVWTTGGSLSIGSFLYPKIPTTKASLGVGVLGSRFNNLHPTQYLYISHPFQRKLDAYGNTIPQFPQLSGSAISSPRISCTSFKVRHCPIGDGKEWLHLQNRYPPIGVDHTLFGLKKEQFMVLLFYATPGSEYWPFVKYFRPLPPKRSKDEVSPQLNDKDKETAASGDGHLVCIVSLSSLSEGPPCYPRCPRTFEAIARLDGASPRLETQNSSKSPTQTTNNPQLNMSSNMLGPHAPRAQLPSVLKPNPSIQTQNMAELSLRAGTAKLAEDNEEELLRLMREHTAVANSLSGPIFPDLNSDTEVGPSLTGYGNSSNASVGRFLRVDSRFFSQSRQQNTYLAPAKSIRSSSPLSILKEEARRAKEALGMTAPPNFPTTLSPEEKANLVAMLPPIEVDVAIYNPFGTFIIPCHDLEITSEMTLHHLINAIQTLVDKNMKPEDFKGGLLVSMIQVKIFNGGKFSKFPKIKGELKGNKVVYPTNESVASPSSSQGGYHAIASTRARVVEEKDIPCASTVKWLVGPGSEEENYWAEYRTALQLAVVMASPKSKSSNNARNNNYGQAYKKSMIKVMTITKIGLLSMFVGVHNFELVPETQDKGKGREEIDSSGEMTDSIQDKGKGIEGAIGKSQDPIVASKLKPGRPKKWSKKKTQSQANASIKDDVKGKGESSNHTINSIDWQERVSNDTRVRSDNNTMGSTRGDGMGNAEAPNNAMGSSSRNKGKGKGKGKAGPNDELIGSIHEKLKIDGRAQALNIGDTDIEFALKFAQSLISEHNAQETAQTQKSRTEKVLSSMAANGRGPLRDMTPKSSKESLPPGSGRGGEKVNWSYYQKMGGNPAMHKLINFDHVPFEPMSVNNWVKPDPEKVEEDLRRAKEALDSQDTTPQMVPYQEIDPLLVDMLMTDQRTIKNAKALEKKDAAVGFDEEDDDKFLYGKTSPVKPAPARLTVSPSTSVSTVPFPTFDPNVLRNDSPGLFAQQTNDGSLPSTNLNHGPLGTSIEDLMKKFNAANPVPSHVYESAGMENQHYTFGGTPLNAQAHYNRTPSPQRSVPASQRAIWVRSPSPGKNMNANNFIPRTTGSLQPQHHEGTSGGANLFHSFSSFNAAAHEMQSQNSGHGFYSLNLNTSPTKSHAQMSGGTGQGQGMAYYNMSPTKTHAQMSRAFNSTAPSPAVGFIPGHQSSGSQGQGYTSGRLSGWSFSPAGATGYNQTSSGNENSGGAFSYQLPSSSQGQTGGGLSNQIPSLGDTPGPNNGGGTQAFYSHSPPNTSAPSNTGTSNPQGTGTPSQGNTTFNIGAGTSRGWNGNGATSTPRNARPTGGYVRRSGQQSQLRADSPSFQFSGGLGVGGNVGVGVGGGGRGRAVSGGLMKDAYRGKVNRGGDGVDGSEE